MTRRTVVVCLVIALLSPLVASAEHTRYWREGDFSDFARGTANGVAVRSDGRLMPAPKFGPFSDPNLAYVWELRLDSRGRLFAAGGSDAKVLRFDASGTAATVFESTELAAQAIAFDAKDNLYVGTSPDGKVYKVTPDGQKSVFFEPKTKYIWALAVDSQGSVFVATGDKGEIFVVAPDGKGQLFYQSEERHARSIAFDTSGNLLVGTEPDGLIIRVGISRKDSGTIPKAGSPFVVYETNKSEVTSLLEDASGNLYAASIGEKVRNQAPPRLTPNVVPSTATPITSSQSIIVVQSQSPTGQQAIPYPFPAANTGGAEVVKIASDGSPQTIWTSRDDLVFAMALAPSGKLLLGTGDNGTIIELESNGIYSSLAKTASAQVTSFVNGAAGKIYVATANAGKVFTLGPDYESSGSFESDPFDAKIFSQWGRANWWGDNGAMQGKVALYVRSGNTSNPENSWSSWAGPYKKPDEAEISCPPGRFLQWKIVFLDPDGRGAPSVSWVSIAYQPKNVAPVIDDVVVQDPGVGLTGYPAQPSGPGASIPVPLRNPRAGGTSTSSPPANGDSTNKTSKVEVPPQGFKEKGYQSILWSSHDANDDELVYSIDYRGEGEQNWRLLKDKITDRYFSWDTSIMPDGAYYLKVIASDSPSNPPDQSLTSERESDRFQVANTPPKIEGLRAETGAATVRISFEGSSSSGAIDHAQYSLDAGDWQIVLPVGKISDSPKESYAIVLARAAPGEHTIAVQITDGFDNVATGKITFSVTGPTPP